MAKANSKNARGGGTIRQRPDGRWEARYTTGRDPGTGRQVQKSVYGDTQAEVRKQLAQITTAIDDGLYTTPSKMTLGAWCDIWTADYMGDKKWSTVKHYRAQIRTHIRPALGAVKLSALTPHQVQRFYNSMSNGEKPLSAKSIKNVHGILTKCLSIALSLGYIKLNPCNACTLPRIERKAITPLNDEQVSAFVESAGNDEYGLLFKVMLFTGLRVSEAIGLTWDCIDFEKGILTVNKQLQKRPLSDGGFTFAPLKNDKTRIIKPAPFVINTLLERRKIQLENRLKAGALWVAWSTPKEQTTALVFTSLLGEHLHQQTVYNHLKKVAVKVGAPDLRVHDLRHTYAVLSLQNGDDVKTVQGNLGHATAAFTLDIYGHVSDKMRDDSSLRMERYIMGL